MTNRQPRTRRTTQQPSTAVSERVPSRTAPERETGIPVPLEVPSALTVHDLATLMNVAPVEVIKELMRNGYMLTVNEAVEHDIAAPIARAFGYRVVPLAEHKRTGSLALSSEGEDPDQLEPRPPIVTILGHVDHGKTTLLDSIRQSNIVAREAGGITQHTGAYQVDYEGNLITFLDTPGHEAFTAMRARGAQVTDIAVLVVAADDGIMPQTIEAIDHARAADVPIIVAINKMDKPEADIERVKRQLSENNLLVEEWGGDVIGVAVSALKGDGISELLENILVLAEVGELKANPHRNAKGVVVEARVDKTRGTLATVLVQTGTLKVGDNMVIGDSKGRVKAMFTERGTRIGRSGPSRPVEVLGVSGALVAGDMFEVAPDETTARRMTEEHVREQRLRREGGLSLEDVHSRIEAGEVKALSLIVKTDVQGSIDAVRTSLEGMNTAHARVNIIHAASGGITEGDVLLAVASQAIIIGFNSRPQPGARALANLERVDIRFYEVIYDLMDDIEKALEGLLEPVYQDVLEGSATIRAVFSVGKRAKAAGFYVNSGRIARDSRILVKRNEGRVFAGGVASLKHFKDDAREVTVGFEGGVALQGFSDFREGDVLEAYRSERVR